MNGMLRLVVGVGAALVVAAPVVPAVAQEAPATAVLVTYASEAGLDRANADGGSLDRADDDATEVATRVAAAELTATEAAALRTQPGVVAVEPDAEVHAAEQPNDQCYVTPIACAPSLGSWFVDRVGLPRAWDLTHGAGTTVAVIDSGIQQSPVIGELSGRVLPEIDATGGTGTPPCSSGSSLDHGTAVAGTVGANTGNGSAIPGAGWDVQVLPVRVFPGPACTTTSVTRLVNGVSLALQAGARILNISATTTSNTTAMRAVLDDAARAGAVVVAAAGNGVGSPAVGTDNPAIGDGGYPAAYPDVIAVGASDPTDARATFSNFGPWVDVFAPGVRLAGLTRSGGLASVSGTSFSAPIVAGVVALMRTVDPGLTPPQISAILTNTADPVAAGPLLDAAEAVAVAACGFDLASGATVAAGAASTRDVVVAGADGRPCSRVSPGSDRNWAPIDGIVVGTPDLVSVGGFEFLVARGGDGAAYLRSRQVGQAWGAWANLGGHFTSDLTITSWGPGRLDVFGRGADGALWTSFYNGGGFSAWQTLGGGLASEPDVTAWGTNRLDVFAVGLDGAMWHRAWTGTTWLPWEGLGGGFRAGPGATSRAANTLDVAARGLDDQLWIRSWLGSSYGPWSSLGGYVASSTDLASFGPSSMLALVRSADGRLWQRELTNAGWSGWQRLP